MWKDTCIPMFITALFTKVEIWKQPKYLSVEGCIKELLYACIVGYFVSQSLSHTLCKLMSIELAMSPNYLVLCHPLLLLPSVFPRIRVSSNDSALHIRPKHWCFTISPFNEYLRLISFRIHWFDFLTVQGTLKNLLQLHCSKASILRCSAFFMVQLSHPYLTTGRNLAYK